LNNLCFNASSMAGIFLKLVLEGRQLQSAVTNAPFAPLHGPPVALLPFDDARSAAQTARSSRAAIITHRMSGRLPSAARRRRCVPAPFPPSLRLHSTFPGRRPQTEAGFYLFRATRRASAWRSNSSRVRAISAAKVDSLGNAVRYARTSILLGKPSIA